MLAGVAVVFLNVRYLPACPSMVKRLAPLVLIKAGVEADQVSVPLMVLRVLADGLISRVKFDPAGFSVQAFSA